ncbi:MAG: glycerol-3-phosphate acyltransferase, partial [Bacillota bacterium]|nr:glycerol-3-phosphate acyltransferase [Bacillota bacterium]
DVFKGIIACLLGYFLLGNDGLMSAGIGAIIGHNWPLYFKFKGGKGVLTSFAVVIMIDWKVSLILLAVFIITVAISRYISLGSLLSAVAFPVAAFIHNGNDKLYVTIALILAILVVIRHRTNIKRIFNGSESKFGKKKAA